MRYVKVSVLMNPKEKPPYFIGSQLRGAFGYALKKVVCINPSLECQGCFAAKNCLFYDFYEKKNSYHTYRFDFELGKPYYDFNLYLFEEAAWQLPYVLSALHRMLTVTGLGKQRRTFENFDIYVNDESCLSEGRLKVPEEYIRELKFPQTVSRITLKFITPLRMKKNNRFIRDDSVEVEDLLSSIYLRESALTGAEKERKVFMTAAKTVRKVFVYKELTRLGNRGRTTMNMGGMIGEMVLKDVSEEVFKLLKTGELIGIGKQTVFGLGKIRVEEN